MIGLGGHYNAHDKTLIYSDIQTCRRLSITLWAAISSTSFSTVVAECHIRFGYVRIVALTYTEEE